MAVFRFDVWLGLVLWASGDGMVESYQCLLEVFHHGEVDFLLVVVPVEVDAKVLLACTIMGDGVMMFEDSHEVLRMLFSHILDDEIVHAKCEAD